MANVEEILQALFIGIAVASVLLQTGRYSKAIELFSECLLFLKKRSLKLQTKKLNELHALICYRLFTLYCVVGDYNNAIQSGGEALLANYENGDIGRAAALLDEMADACLSSNCERENPIKSFERVLNSLIETSTFCWENAFKETLGKTFLKLGDYSMSHFDYTSAKGHFEKAFTMWKETGNRKQEGIALIRLAYACDENEEYQQAKKHCENAIAVFEEAGEMHHLGAAWGWLGKMCAILGEFGKAKTLHKKALEMSVKMENKIGQIIMYRHLAKVHVNLSEHKDAMECYQNALALSKDVGDRNEEASIYSCMGKTFYRSLDDFQNAEYYCKKARTIYRELGDRLQEGIETSELGRLYSFLGKYNEAIKCHERGIAINKQIGNRLGEGGEYGNLGAVYGCLGDHDKAKECYEIALPIFKETNHLRGQGTVYGSLGTVYHSLGDFTAAYDHFKRALEVDIRIDNKEGLPVAYSNMGVVCKSLGELTKASKFFKRALAAAKEIAERAKEALILGHLASMENEIGEPEKAKAYYEQALQISKETGDIRGEAYISGSLGKVHCSLGDSFAAREFLEKSLEIMKRIKSKEGESTANSNLGDFYNSLGEYTTARAFYEQALKISRQTGNKGDQMSMCNAIGGMYFHENNSEEALKYFQEALLISKMIGKVKGKNAANCNIAVTYLALCRDVPKALLFLSESIKGLEEMRESVGESEYYKIGFADANVDYYQLMVLLLLSEGCIDLALSMLELARARLLTEVMATRYCCQNLPGYYRNIWTDFTCVIRTKSCTCLSFCFFQEHLFSCWIIRCGKAEFVVNNRLTADIPPQGTSVQDWLESLANECVRTFLLLPEEQCEDRSLFLWDEHTEARSPLKVEEGPPTSQIKEPRQQQQKQEDDKEPQALRDLYKFIITPVEKFLKGSELIIVPDRSLYRVPFAALKDESGEYLSEKFRIRFVPSLTTLKLIQDSPANYHSQTGVLIVGDPEVGLPECPPLPCAREEAEMIGQLLRVRPLTGKQATKQAVLQRIHSVNLIHIASHGNADRGDIALAPTQNVRGKPKKEDFVLTMSDISKVQLRAKLVVLSCCHSARGQIKAEGVVGIARAFLGSGARSVLVSLWAVDDIATMQFMKQFYGHLVHGKSASECLHETMKWMRGSPEYHEVRKWAPFMLIGDDVSFDFSK